MKHPALLVKELYEIPEHFDEHTVYRLLPCDDTEFAYFQRTNRAIGWQLPDDQKILKAKKVVVGGSGGMGGEFEDIMVRSGIGELVFLDPEKFDESNINRQRAAYRDTIGVNKAFATLCELRRIANDTIITAYPQGVTEDTIEHALQGADVYCDLVEFWAISARILGHRVARELGIPIIMADTVGYRTNVFYFTKDSMTIEEALGISYDEALRLEKLYQEGDTTPLMSFRKNLSQIFAPVVPEYSRDISEYSTYAAVLGRIDKTKEASITPSNPPTAAGILATRVTLELLKGQSFQRNEQPLIPMPGYLWFDAVTWESGSMQGVWWNKTLPS